MSSGKRRGGGSGRRTTESGVAEKLARIRERRAQRAANRDEPEVEAEDDSEATQAFSLDDFDLPPEEPKAASRQAAAAPDDDDQATAAFSIDDFQIREMQARNKRALEARAATAAEPEPDEDDDERTAAFSIDDMGHLDAPAPAPAPAAPVYEDDDEDEDFAATAAFAIPDEMAQRRRPAPPEPATIDTSDDEDEEEERTMAVSLDEIGLDEPEPEYEESARTMMVDLDDLPAPSRRRAPEPVAAAAPRLVIVAGNDAGKEFEITQSKTLIGRGLDADFVINDASASRKHFNIIESRGSWKLVDLGSGNGTRVNGERVAEMDLRDGMRIEAGGTTLNWKHPQAAVAAATADYTEDSPTLASIDDDDGEKTMMGDMAALEIDPDWEARRARQVVSDFSQPPEIAAPPEVAIEAPRASSGGGGGKGKLIAIIGGLLVLLGGGFVAADKFGGLGIIFDKDAETDTPIADGDGDGDKTGDGDKVAAGGSDNEEKAMALVDEAKESFKARRWHEARDKFKAARALDKKNDEAEIGVLDAEDQLAAWNDLEDGRKAIDEDRFADAMTTLKKIQSTSVYHDEAHTLLKTARDELVVQALANARELEAKEDYDGAKAEVEKALAVASEDADALMFKEALARASAPDADTLAPEDEDDPEAPARPTRKVAKKDFSGGFSKYAAGDFMGAINFFDEIQYGGEASRRDVSKAKAVAAAITKFETIFRQGKDAVAAGKVSVALEKLAGAKKLDAAINSSFKRQVNAEIAKAHAITAKAALEKKQLSKAGGAARKALAADSTNADARSVMDEVKSKAEGWVTEAEGLADSNKDKAMKLLADALRVLPDSDPKAKSAYKLLNQLASQDEE